MVIRRTTPALAIAAVALAGLLSACSSGVDVSNAKPVDTSAAEQPAESESTGGNNAEDCAALASTMQDAASSLQDGVGSMSDDPAAAVESLKVFAGELDSARESLGDGEVKDQADATAGALDEMIVAVEAIVADPASADASGLMEKVTAVQTELTAIGDVC